MDPQQAIDEIRSIQSQLIHAEKVDCYRWATNAMSGLIGLIAATFQPNWIGSDSMIGGKNVEQGIAFFWYWSFVAVICVATIGAEMFWRYLQDSAYGKKQTTAAVFDFLPSVLIAALLSVLFVYAHSIYLQLLAGLWAVFFGLGIFASRRRMPPTITWVGLWYFGCGLLSIFVGQPFAAWKMALSFGIGQLLMAGLLFRSQAEVLE